MEKYSKYIDIATDEIRNPSFEVTKQYLEVCELYIENDQFVIERINVNKNGNLVEIFFRINDEDFFFVVGISESDPNDVQCIYIENGHKIYLSAVSENINFKELKEKFRCENGISGWSKGDKRQYGNGVYSFTRLIYEPIEGLAYDFNEKLDLLLDNLEEKKSDLNRLVECAEVQIQVCKYQYVSANAGTHLDKTTIKRLSKLNLSLDIDTYIVGERIKG